MSDKIQYNFGAINVDFLVRQNYSELFQTSHIPRTDHQNRYFCDFDLEKRRVLSNLLFATYTVADLRFRLFILDMANLGSFRVIFQLV